MELKELHYAQAPWIKGRLPGPKAQQIIAEQEALESNARKYSRVIPFVPEDAKGATIKDADGNIFLDFFAGISVLNFGHSNPAAIAAVQKQQAAMVHSLDFATRTRTEFMALLRSIAPGNLKDRARIMFGGPTGSDAVEGAVKLAKVFTGRHALLAFSGSYHGQTAGALSLSAGREHREPYLPLLNDVHFAPYPYCYRCAFGQKPSSCRHLCLNYLANMLRDSHSGLPRFAAVIVEPIQGEGGIVVPPDWFLPELSDICREHGIVLIVDEIQSGLGRTGKMFACEHWNVTPDVMTSAKSLGGIGFPLSAVLYAPELDVMPPGGHIGTFRGHLVGMAAGKACIEFMQQEHLLKHVQRLGTLMQDALVVLEDEIEAVGETRGKGLLWGIEFVSDARSKEPAPDLVERIRYRCFERGLLVWTAGRYGNVVRLLPPLVITEELLTKGLAIFGAVVREVCEKPSLRTD